MRHQRRRSGDMVAVLCKKLQKSVANVIGRFHGAFVIKALRSGKDKAPFNELLASLSYKEAKWREQHGYEQWLESQNRSRNIGA